MLDIIIALAKIWIGVICAYPAVMAAKHVVQSGRRLTWFWKVHLYPLAVVAGILDVAFNYTFGWLMYWEHPRWKEPLFSSRVQRHIRRAEPGSRKERLSRFWQKQLNLFDPNHVRG